MCLRDPIWAMAMGKHLHGGECFIQNSYRASSIKAATYEACMGENVDLRFCMCWPRLGDVQMIWSELIHETTERSFLIQGKGCKLAQDDKSYVRSKAQADGRVLAKVGKVAYRLELPQELSRVHHTFHVS
ncbi:hypothetical protein Tco_0236787 [Tanacetum coccineum]